MTDGKQEHEQQNFDFAFGAENIPDKHKPWTDDKLERERFGARLTNFAKGIGKNAAFVVSVDGEWGSGKTFLLKRWRQQLHNDGRKAIYFNAWEDDFHSNPLAAIVGQLWNAIKGPDWGEIKKSLKKAVPAVVGKTAASFLGLTKKDLQSSAEQTADEYLIVREKLDDFKARLAELAGAVRTETGFPLIFIIDELDRCRPTFAIELLERVKHALNVPGVLFVFGVNKTQLAKSIRSVYGDIDAEDYLQRFFDVSLVMTPADSCAYCRHLLEKYEVLKCILQSGVHNARYGRARWNGSWEEAVDIFPTMVRYMNLSLREVEHSLRMLLFVLYSKEAKDPNEWRMHQGEGWAVVCMIFLRLKFPELHRDFVRDECKSAAVIDAMHARFPSDSALQEISDEEHVYLCLNVIEIEFYRLAALRDRKVIQSSIYARARGGDNNANLAKRTKSQGAQHARMIAEHMCGHLDPKKISGMLDLVDGAYESAL